MPDSADFLVRFESATHGEIFLDGQPINNVAPHKHGIGMVFQNYALFPHMTVFANLAFPLQVRRMAKADIETTVQRALDMVRLGAFGNRRPGQLSGGQQQRVAVAMIGKHADAGIEMGPHMPTAPDNFKTALMNDFEFWADHTDELNERFNAWLAK